MADENEISPPIIVTAPEDGEIARLTNIQQLGEFIERERKFWQTLQSGAANKHYGVEQATNVQNNWSSSLDQALNRIRSSDPKQRAEGLASARALIEQIKTRQVISLVSTEGRKIEELRKTDHVAAGIRLARLLGKLHERGPNQLDLPTTRAAITEFLSERDPREWAAIRDDIFLDRRKKWDEWIGESQATFSKLQDALAESVVAARDKLGEIATLETNSKALIEKFLTETKEKQTKSVEEFDRLLKEMEASSKSDFENFRAALRSQLRLQAPATYWRKKALKQRVSMIVGLAAFVVAIWGIVWFFVRHGVEIVASLPKDTAGGFFLGELVVLTIPALACFWLLRYLGRIFVVNHAGAADSALRATMTETFLALAADGASGIGDAERLVILQALFRSRSSEGDDAPPPNLLEIIKSTLTDNRKTP